MTCVSMKTPCNYFTLLLTVSHSSRSNSWRDNFMKTRWWRSWCHAVDEGDHAAPRRWRSKAQDDIGHITSLYDLHVMFVMFTSYLLRTTVAKKRWSLTKISRDVFPLTVHRCEGSLFRSTTWWSGVIDSNVRIQRVLTSLACTDMASEHTQYT